ncbi:hypothetical protein B9Z19DRAFT_1128751 [Tuber borchii]|uniref:EamA domain-containing protein n=1 Tax=Tuber borchii TaxID=42251 RepID=A0A2T6ZNQ6_TUBBO|nr:hypothetical protein B9Z19DRAFT_1128751 [Tuber borchii]
MRSLLAINWELERRGHGHGHVHRLCTRVLETSFPEQKMHAMQILFIRQSVTAVVVEVLMALLVFSDYTVDSLAYLDLSDAKVITFLAPIATTFACSLIPFLNESFTKTEFFASLLSLFGVALIARPASLFSRDPANTPNDPSTVHSPPTPRSLLPAREIPTATPHQRLIAVLIALLGVLGVATAFITIRWIGPRAHALITEKAGSAANMFYTRMLFALAWELIFWGTTPGWESMVGSGCILGSVLWVGMKKAEKPDIAKVRAVDEEVGLMSGRVEGEEEEEGNE